MIIDNHDLHEIFVPNIHGKKNINNEHFYCVPGATGYVLSNYGRLYCQCQKGNYKPEHMFYSLKHRAYAYEVRFNGETCKATVTVRRLMAMVFYPGQRVYLWNPKYTASLKTEWYINDLHPLHGREKIAEAIQAKIDGREATYDEDLKGATFINRIDPATTPFKKFLTKRYNLMVSRATNPATKIEKPQYANTTIDKDLLDNPQLFYQWFIDKYYSYPETLEIDKDILSFGEQDRYSLSTIALIPGRINRLFRRNLGKNNLGYGIKCKDGTKYTVYAQITLTEDGKITRKRTTVDTYIEALHIGRKTQADYIRLIVQREQQLGLMPESTLQAMCKWANRCELGMVKIWEPSEETLKEMGVL